MSLRMAGKQSPLISKQRLPRTFPHEHDTVVRELDRAPLEIDPVQLRQTLFSSFQL